jgi:very-short-patch-repair endonuclease
MSTVANWVISLGGIAQKQQLVALGATDYGLTVAVRSGAVFRARHGWYSTVPASEEVLRAVRVGGRLTGLCAIRELGGWAWSSGTLHVSVPRNGARHRSQWNSTVRLSVATRTGVVLHWDGDHVVGRGTRTTVALQDALLRVVLDENLEEAVAALDWALHLGMLGPQAFEELIDRLPPRLRPIRDWVDPACESFPESLARTRLRMRGYRVRSQVPMNGSRRIDLVVEEQVALEVDGDEFHRDKFIEDRYKDLFITVLHLHVIRPPAIAIFNDWDFVLAAIEAALGRTAIVAENSGTDPLSRGADPPKWREHGDQERP